MGQMFNQQPAQQQGPPPVPGTYAPFYIAVNGQQQGPFPMQTLQQMHLQGSFTRETLVWKHGMANWSKAGELAELTSVFSAVPPPLPPQ